MDTEIIIPEDQLSKIDRFQKSNFLISGKYEAPIMSSRLMALAMSQLQHANVGKNGELIVRISSKQIKATLGLSGGSCYDEIKKAANTMTGVTVGFVDDDRHMFEYIAVVTRSTYMDSELEVVFNRDMSNYLMNIKNNFTILRLSTLMKFRRTYSFRLYEVCKSKAYSYFAVHKDNAEYYQFEMGVAELKFTMGVLNVNDPLAVKYLNHQNPTEHDYEKAARAVKEQKLIAWRDFRRSALVPAVKEINEKSDIKVEFMPVSSGTNRTVTAVSFNVYLEEKEDKKSPFKKEKKESRASFVSALDEIAKATSIPFLPSQINALISEANGDTDLVIEKCRLCEKTMKEQKKKIDNPVGWIRAAIRQNFADVIDMPDGGVARKEDIYISPDGEEVDITTLPKAFREIALKTYTKKFPD